MSEDVVPFLGHGRLACDLQCALVGAVGEGSPAGGFVGKGDGEEAVGAAGVSGERHLEQESEVHPLDRVQNGSLGLLGALGKVLLVAGLAVEGEKIGLGGVDPAEFEEELLPPLARSCIRSRQSRPISF